MIYLELKIGIVGFVHYCMWFHLLTLSDLNFHNSLIHSEVMYWHLNKRALISYEEIFVLFYSKDSWPSLKEPSVKLFIELDEQRIECVEKNSCCNCVGGEVGSFLYSSGGKKSCQNAMWDCRLISGKHGGVLWHIGS